mgnify:CR=1 FL=1
MLKNFFKDYTKNYWRNIDKSIFLSFLLLFALGIFFSFSSTSPLAGERLNKDYYFFFSKHLIFAILGIFLMIIISSIKLDLFKKILLPVFVIAITLLILVFFFWCRSKRFKTVVKFIIFSFSTYRVRKTFFYCYYC